MPKHKSRQTRCNEVTADIYKGHELLSEERKYSVAAQELITGRISELEELLEEIGSWRDNIEEKFSQTEKYSTLCDTYDTLEDVINNLQDLDDLETFFSELEEDDQDSIDLMLEELEGIIANLESLEFPRAFGN